MIQESLTHYRILEKIGAGGMGEVYRAEDTKLKRQVAIKVLPAAFAQDSERMKRLEREAQVLASLNHPNIAAIHGLEESDGQRFLVLELAEGEDLSERLSRGAIPLDDAIQIAKQIAEGLEQAHEKGIIHRDLKPANVKVSADGVVKILDFGLAKAMGGDTQEVSSSNPSQSPTLARPATVAGVILGTPAYMSPEQARGKAVDRRADIWAFGLVLYEMLTGRRPFEDETEEPGFDSLPVATPLPIRRLLRRCLQRDPKRRLQAIGDARLELEETHDAPSPRVQHRALPIALIVAAAAAGALAMWLLMPSSNQSTRVVRSVLTDADGLPIHVHTHTTGPALILSPDGSRIVYNPDRGDGGSLDIRSFSDFVSEPLPNLGGHAHPLAFAPDGNSILFTLSGTGLYRVGLASGSLPLRLCETSTIVWGAVWFPDDTIVFAAGAPSSLYRVPAAGGTPEPLTLIGKWNLKWPSALPGSDRLLVGASSADGSGSTDVAIVSLGTGEVRVVQPGGTMPRYLPTGHLVFGAENQLRAVRFDPGKGATAGASVSLIDGVETNEVAAANYAVSRDGALVFLSGSGSTHPVWVDRTGRETPLPVETGRYNEPRISPEGTRVAFADGSGRSDFLVWDEARKVLTSAPREAPAFNIGAPLWAPDGRDLLFSVGLFAQSQLFRRAASVATAAVDLNVRGFSAISWSPDGKTLLLRKSQGDKNDIFVLSMADNAQPEPLLATSSDERGATLSPDGRWLAYTSNESGRREVYVRPFPELNGGKWLISTDGGEWPLWTRAGRELVYLSGTKLMAVPVSADESFKPGLPKEIWNRPYLTRPSARNYDVSPDGERFLLVGGGGVFIQLVQNWFEEVKAKVGSPP